MRSERTEAPVFPILKLSVVEIGRCLRRLIGEGAGHVAAECDGIFSKRGGGSVLNGNKWLLY